MPSKIKQINLEQKKLRENFVTFHTPNTTIRPMLWMQQKYYINNYTRLWFFLHNARWYRFNKATINLPNKSSKPRASAMFVIVNIWRLFSTDNSDNICIPYSSRSFSIAVKMLFSTVRTILTQQNSVTVGDTLPPSISYVTPNHCDTRAVVLLAVTDLQDSHVALLMVGNWKIRISDSMMFL